MPARPTARARRCARRARPPARPPARAGLRRAPRRPARRPSGGSGPPWRRPHSPSALPGAVPSTLLRTARVAFTSMLCAASLCLAQRAAPAAAAFIERASRHGACLAVARPHAPVSFGTSRVEHLHRRHRPTCCRVEQRLEPAAPLFRRRAAVWRPSGPRRRARRFNASVFGGQLPGDLAIGWNAHLLTTAGLTHYRRDAAAAPGGAPRCNHGRGGPVTGSSVWVGLVGDARPPHSGSEPRQQARSTMVAGAEARLATLGRLASRSP